MITAWVTSRCVIAAAKLMATEPQFWSAVPCGLSSDGKLLQAFANPGFIDMPKC